MGCIGGKKKEWKRIRMSKSIEKKKERLHEIKVVLLGDPSVGKSSLMKRFCLDRFEEKYSITIGSERSKIRKWRYFNITYMGYWRTRKI